MNCSNCGTQSPAGFAYCGNCGTRLAVAEAAATETRRQVAVLFADVVGFTALAEKLDPEELRSVVGSLLAELSAEVYAQGGRVDMYAGDSIMATFGAPVAHENDPALACQAALGMLEKAKGAGKTGQSLKIRIGINWGEVIYGRIGDSDRFTVLGDAVNVASRLQSSAEPNTAYVSDSVMARTSHFYEFTPIGEISVKNREKPVSTFQLVGISSAPEKERGIRGKTAVWVDRECELEFLGDWFGKLGTDSSVLLITGDGGIGKSRLWEEAYRRTSGRSHRLISMRCHSYNNTVPFASVADFGRAWLDLPARCTPVLMESTVEERLHSLGFTSNRMEKELLLLMLSGVARGSVADMDASVRMELLTSTLERILNAESTHCALILELDDFHWADVEGRDFLLDILPGIQDLNTILISRRQIDRSLLPAGADTLHIEPLPHAEALQLVKLLLGGEIAGLNERICDVAEGNPYYTEEIIKHLSASGYLALGKGTTPTLTKPLDEIPLPPTLIAFITQKIDSCSAMARQVLSALSVLETADEELLGEVSGAGDLADALDELKEQYLIGGNPDGRISPINELVMETALKGMLGHDRKRMHAKAASILIGRHQSGEDQLPVIIHHLLETGQNDEAVPWLMESGSRVLAQGGLEAALGVFRQAKSLLTPNSDFHLTIRIILRELEVMLALFQAKEASEMIVEIPLKLCSDNEKAQLSVLSLLAKLRSDDVHGALQLVPSCLNQETHLTPASRAILHLYIAQALARNHQLPAAINEAKLSLRRGRAIADVAVAASANNVLGVIYNNYLGQWEKALHYLLAALKLRRRLGKKNEIASTLCNIASAYMFLQKVKPLKKYALEALDYARMSGEKIAEGSSLINLGNASLLNFQWSIAEGYFTEAFDLYNLMGAESPKNIASLSLVLILVITGHFAQAEKKLLAQRDALKSIGDLTQLYELEIMLMELYYTMGEYKKALSLSNGFVQEEKLQQDDERHEYIVQMNIILEMLLGTNAGFTNSDYLDALRWLRNKKQLLYFDFVPLVLDFLYRGKPIDSQIAKRLRDAQITTTDKREKLQFNFLQGVLLLSSGQHQEAVRVLRKTLKQFRKVDMNYFVVLSSLHLGRALRKTGMNTQAVKVLQSSMLSLKVIANKHLEQAIALELVRAGGEHPIADDGYLGQL